MESIQKIKMLKRWGIKRVCFLRGSRGYMTLPERPEAISIWMRAEYKFEEKSDENGLGENKSNAFEECNSGGKGTLSKESIL